MEELSYHFTDVSQPEMQRVFKWFCDAFHVLSLQLFFQEKSIWGFYSLFVTLGLKAPHEGAQCHYPLYTAVKSSRET